MSEHCGHLYWNLPLYITEPQRKEPTHFPLPCSARCVPDILQFGMLTKSISRATRDDIERDVQRDDNVLSTMFRHYNGTETIYISVYSGKVSLYVI